MKPAVLDKNLVRVHACHNYAGEENSSTFAFESFRVGARSLAFRFQGNSGCIQKIQVGSVANQRENKIVLYQSFPLRCLQQDAIWPDFHNLGMKIRFDFTTLNSVLNIWPDPILHFFGYLPATMNECNSRTRPEKFEGGDGCGIFCAYDRNILVVVWMRFFVVVEDLR